MIQNTFYLTLFKCCIFFLQCSTLVDTSLSENMDRGLIKTLWYVLVCISCTVSQWRWMCRNVFGCSVDRLKESLFTEFSQQTLTLKCHGDGHGQKHQLSVYLPSLTPWIESKDGVFFSQPQKTVFWILQYIKDKSKWKFRSEKDSFRWTLLSLFNLWVGNCFFCLFFFIPFTTNQTHHHIWVFSRAHDRFLD